MFMKLIHKTYDDGKIVIWIFLVQYLVILLIPIVSIFCIYFSTIRVMTDELAEKNYMLLDKGKNAVEQDLSRVSMAFQQIENDPTVLNFKNLSDPYEGSHVIQVNNLQHVLVNYRLCDNLIYNYYILFDNNHAVISPYASSTLDTFYKTCFSYPAMTRDEWYKTWTRTYRDQYITFLPAAQVLNFKQSGSMVTVIKSVKNFNRYEGITVVLLLNNSQLQKQLGSVYAEKQMQSSVFIVDRSGAILTCSGNGNMERISSQIVLENARSFSKDRGSREIAVDGMKMLLTYTNPNEMGWRYVSVQPLDSAFAKVSYIKSIIVMIICLDLLASLFLIAFLIRINGRPARQLLMIAMRSQQPANRKTYRIFEVIQSAFSNLTNQYDSVSQKLQSQNSYLRKSFLDRLFSGGLKSTEEIDTLMANSGTDMHAAFYTAALLCINEFEDITTDEEFEQLNEKMLSLETGLSCLPFTDLVVHKIENNQLALLVLGRCETPEEHQKKTRFVMQQVQNVVARFREVDASIYVGNVCGNIMKVPLSVETARQCMLFDRTEGNGTDIVWFEDIGETLTGYYYPRVMETRLINSVLSGNEKETLEIIDEIYEENHTIRHLPIGMIRLLMYELYGTMLRIIDNGNMGKNGGLIKHIFTQMEEIGQLPFANVLVERIRETYVCGCSMMARNKKDNGVVENVVRYLNESYMQDDLTLTMLTEKFGISQAYLSRQFKDAMNCTVYEYLEKLRIEKACQMLSEGNLSVKKIAERVGYVSSNTFCRAFKRISGVRASDYRKMKRM